ncbi:unnamed protein product [Owenia fusiformis]|uniref:Uncharacterized protein n=1 Tax=Owenia fusiformis TaxID=6347 RepID=A0A8J1USX7_OWEFU|nr:unnamed protein product [Owenia fusiformis]
MPAVHATYPCHCGKQYKQAVSLARHKRLEHDKNHETYQCHCGKLFSRKDRLKRHEKLHKTPEHKCTECESVFHRSESLRNHVISRHNQIGAGPLASETALPASSEDQSTEMSSADQSTNLPMTDNPPSSTETIPLSEPNTLSQSSGSSPRIADIGEQESTNEQDECEFEEGLNGALKTVTIKISGLSKFDPLRLFKEQESKIKSVLLKQMKKKGAIKWYGAINVQFKKEKKEETEIARPHFRGRCYTMMKPIDLNEAWQETVKKIYDSFIKYQREGSAWQLDFVISFKIHMAVYKPIRGSSYIPTPLTLKDN